ncbi:MAG: YdcF family protein [Candidatus Saccharimonadales bacterium]
MLIRWLLRLVAPLLLIVVGLLLLGFYISPRDDLRESDVIVAVSGGDTAARTQEAIRLYQEGWAPRLLFSGAALDPVSKSNAEVMRDIAISAGVPPDVIITEEFSDNTRENAERSARLISALRNESIILVTSPYHQRRTYIEFNSQLGGDVEIINHPAPDERWSRSQWWRSPFGWYITATESPKVLYALLQS